MQVRLSGHQTRQPLKACRNIRLLLAFNGATFHGWQAQTDKPTVQGAIRDAIEKITGEQVKLTGSGRTDAGTHARGLVANFVTDSPMPVRAWVPALNRQLPQDLRVLSASRVPLTFHARLSASSKVYRYQIYRGAVMPPHMAQEHLLFPLPLDVPLMQRAAKLFVGKHDFASFAAYSGLRRRKAIPDSDRSYASSSNSHETEVAGRQDPGALNGTGIPELSTTRRIFHCELKSRGRQLIFTVEGNGFLHHMVRNMMGTLLEVGRGRISLELFRELFHRRDRTLAGFTAPAHGLILLRVHYQRRQAASSE